MAADVKTHLYEWSTTESSNLPVGSTVVSTNLDDNLRMIQKVVRDLSAPTTLGGGPFVQVRLNVCSHLNLRTSAGPVPTLIPPRRMSVWTAFLSVRTCHSLETSHWRCSTGPAASRY